ncbi:MAG: response regulator [Anaerolineae bacterium]|jgi:CheY-like chemotaxis protein
MSRILVVDDDPDFCEAMRLVLTSAGHAVEIASNGDQALAMATQAPPDLIILDIMMQGPLDGLVAAHSLEENQRLHGIPVIMVSSIADSPLAGLFPTDEYLPTDAWFSKPVQPGRLLKSVERLLHTKAA